MAMYTNGALSSTKQGVKNERGTLRMISVVNNGASDAYVQVWAVPSASVTVGSTAPALILWVPAGTARERNFILPDGRGREMMLGITIAATTTATGSSAPATALVIEDLEHT